MTLIKQIQKYVSILWHSRTKIYTVVSGFCEAPYFSTPVLMCAPSFHVSFRIFIETVSWVCQETLILSRNAPCYISSLGDSTL